MFVLQTQRLAIGFREARAPKLVIAQDLNLTVARGELICLLGPNGVGKSTLLRTFAGIQKPLGGRVFLSGEDITQLAPRQLAQRLSMVLAERPHLGLLNGYALVALGRQPHTDWLGRLTRYDEAIIRWAVDAVDAANFAERPVMALSDGQRQKLLIARALAQESDLILMDEPTAFLDLPRRAEIMGLLRHLAAETGRAIVLSTHDLDLALRSADTLWLMSDGQVHVGAPEDLVLNGAFEMAFASEKIIFDRATGTFSVRTQDRGVIAVHGQGDLQTWTRRALQRVGYTVTANGASPKASIEIAGDVFRPIWHLCRDGKLTQHYSIGDLLAALAAHTKQGVL
ncbi:MAG: ABC transporter ATP-binding protein [Aggregatilineales bacterium]